MHRLASYLRQPVLGWYPSDWALQASPQRLDDCIAWDRLTLRPKYNLEFGCRAVASVTSSSAADYGALLRLLDRSRSSDERLQTAILNAMGVRYILVPAQEAAAYVAAGRLVVPPEAESQDYRMVRNATAFPRAWIVHQVLRLPPPACRSWQELDRRTRQVFCEGDRVRDLSQVVVIEADEPSLVAAAESVPPARPLAEDEGPEACVVTDQGPTEVRVEATLQRPGFVVLNDAFADGWNCTCDGGTGSAASVPVLRHNRVMRGVALPAGRHHLVFRYRPAAVVWGGLISVLSGLALTLRLGWILGQRHCCRHPVQDAATAPTPCPGLSAAANQGR